jgi:hypothetical protein
MSHASMDDPKTARILHHYMMITENVVTKALADRDQGSMLYSSIFVRASYDPKYPPHVRKLKTDGKY